jgi:antitoxin component of MazEF toxin-antitoxin module
MRDLRTLTRNGNATTVVICRPLLVQLGWLPGTKVVVELLEDNTLRIRPLDDAAFQPKRIPHVVHDTPDTVGR